MSRPLVIKLVRHGESEANTGAYDPQMQGDYRASLTGRGVEQSFAAGESIGAPFLRRALVYLSPYHRTRQTLDALMDGARAAREASLGVYEDPRLREMDHGYSNVLAQHPMRARHGWFYYRYEGGESPADVYDRVSGFLESMMRQVERKHATKVLVVTHGMAIRCFVMRYLRLSVEEFEQMENPGNGTIVTVGPSDEIENPSLERGPWRVTGIVLRAT